MNPLTGRFMSRDPWQFCNCSIDNPASLHNYLYAHGDPVDLADPLGTRAEPIPEPEPPGPEPVPDPEPQPGRANSGAAVEYALIVGEISLGSVAGIKAVGDEVSCALYGAASALGAVRENIGALRSLQINWSKCSATASRLPHIPAYGDRPAPFDPEDVITTPGTPWRCQDGGDCEAPCPPGSKRDHEKLHWDPGSRGEPPHWDYTDCNGDTWKIYLDGTMGPA
jgi:Flp pilus assembly pilin Flp